MSKTQQEWYCEQCGVSGCVERGWGNDLAAGNAALKEDHKIRSPECWFDMPQRREQPEPEKNGEVQ